MNDPLAAEWLAYLIAEGKPPNTVSRRKSVLHSVGNPSTATREDIEGWWASRRNLSPATRSNDLACLRAFYRWCQRWEHRADDPTLRLDAPKVSKGLPRGHSRADVLSLLRALDDDLRRAVALGAYAGLRVSEAASLMWDDVDLETRRARVVGKGGKHRIVALGVVLLDILAPPIPGANIVTGTAIVPDAASFQRRVNRAMQRTLGPDAGFHRLRHRYGTLAYQATRDLIAVGRQMGHSSPVTTAVYAAASDDAADVMAEAVAR